MSSSHLYSPLVTWRQLRKILSLLSTSQVATNRMKKKKKEENDENDDEKENKVVKPAVVKPKIYIQCLIHASK